MKKVKLLCSLFAAFLLSGSMWATNVAKIGSTEYADLATAIGAVQDGQTITIINDITVTGWVTINKPEVAFTIDLNGKKIEHTDGSIFDIYSKVTFKDSQTGGTIKAHGRALYGNEGADFTLESGNIIGTDGNVINVIGDYGSAMKPAKFTMNGGAVTCVGAVNLQGEQYGAEFVMNGGTITSTGAGLTWWGNNTEDAVKITINAGTIIGVGEGALNGNGSKSGAKVIIKDGTFTCDGGSAMYLPYQGNTTISGGTFTGAEALVIKSGNVSISGGTFIANGAAIDPTSAGESAYAQTGDAIYVEDNYGVSDYTFSHNITLNITGGVFTSTNANAISARFSNAHASKVPAQITISGGQFKSATNKAVIHTSNGFAGSIVASAGVYNLAPAQDYIVTGKMAVANTDEATKVAYPWMIGLPSNVAKIGTTEYATLEAAVAAAQSGDVITILCDIEENVTVNKKVSIDLNGKFWRSTSTYPNKQLCVGKDGDVTIVDNSSSVSHKFVPNSNGLWVLNDDATGTEGTDYFTLEGGAIYGANDRGAISVLGKLTIASGNIVGNQNTYSGVGAVPCGGAIYVGNEGTHGKLVITGGTLAGNYANGAGGAVYAENGDITISDGIFKYNTSASYAGAVSANNASSISTNSELNITGGIFDHNKALNGGAIHYTDNYENSTRVLTISGGTFTNNTATKQGGAVYFGGAMEISGGTFSNNTASTGGGAILAAGNLSLSGGVISNNTSSNSGGAIYTQANTMTMTGGKIINNSVTASGAYAGGIYNANSSAVGSLTISGGEISGNTASGIGGGIWSCGVLTIQDGAVIKDNIANGTDATKNGGANIFINDGGLGEGKTKLIVTGGTITGGTVDATSGKGAGIYVRTNNGAPTVTISGGTINDVYVNGTKNKGLYTGSEITGGKMYSVVSDDAAAVNFISGGIFTLEPVNDVIATGYIKVDNADEDTKVAYPYTVINAGEVTDGASKPIENAKAEVSSTLAYWKEATPETITIKRNIYKDGYYNTLCLPFALTAEQIATTFGEAPKELKKFNKATVQGEGASREIVLDLEDATSIEAGKAYLITFASGTTLTELVFSGVTVTTTTATAQTGDLVYQGILAPYQMPYENENYLFVGEQNKLYWAIDDGTFMKGFRAYFKVDNTPKSPYRFGMKASFGSKNTPTGNANVNANANEIKKLIENGRVFIMNNGVKYDMNGKVVE